MKNSKLRRALLLLACAVLLVSLSVGATLAYLTSTTKEVNNTFTVGHVTITLDEGDVWEAADEDVAKKKDGSLVTEEDLGKHKDTGVPRVQTNNYDLFPGHTYDKDPIIHVDAKSEDCYVVAKIVVTADSIANLRKQFSYEGGGNMLGLAGYVTGGVFTGDLKPVAGTTDGSKYENDTVILEQEANTADNTFWVYYKNPQVAGANLTLFTNIVIPSTWTADDLANLAGLKIDIIAYAIQSDNFTDVKTAFAAGNFE